MSVRRGVAVNLEAGADVCGALDVVMEDDDVTSVRPLFGACPKWPAILWLGKVGICEDHVQTLWPELVT